MFSIVVLCYYAEIAPRSFSSWSFSSIFLFLTIHKYNSELYISPALFYHMQKEHTVTVYIPVSVVLWRMPGLSAADDDLVSVSQPLSSGCLVPSLGLTSRLSTVQNKKRAGFAKWRQNNKLNLAEFSTLHCCTRFFTIQAHSWSCTLNSSTQLPCSCSQIKFPFQQ